MLLQLNYLNLQLFNFSSSGQQKNQTQHLFVVTTHIEGLKDKTINNICMTLMARLQMTHSVVNTYYY